MSDLRVLICEDEASSQKILSGFLSEYGSCDYALNGKEAVEMFQQAFSAGNPYQLVCLDIMMPEMDGQEALKQIRELEQANNIAPGDGTKVIMVTSVDDASSVIGAYKTGAEAYVVKPIERASVLKELEKLKLIPAGG